ncbi:MAG: 1-acyl-sn-glycerol-3-phosphate acyltransferase [Cyanobacteria bacterium]|nr:1-acyl-sn-glycerol-3-phosphate acyltransferase [Cyanobacteriota bacterium]MDW8201654.1 lysophospholipid acyltransferase family protein [Cyanobacteriota bacterium SKYGB_h_bin112]
MTIDVQINPWLYCFLLPVHRLFLSLYFSQIVIHNYHHLPTQGPLILAVKHYSRWDPVIVPLLSTTPYYFLTNANQFEGVQGWFISRLGAFPVDVDQPKPSSLRTVVTLLQQGKKLVIFPEGGIVTNQPLRSLKPGLARLVLQAEKDGQSIPIVPVALRYRPVDRVRARVDLNLCPPIVSCHYRQATDKQTAIAMTTALERSLLTGLAALGL